MIMNGLNLTFIVHMKVAERKSSRSYMKTVDDTYIYNPTCADVYCKYILLVALIRLFNYFYSSHVLQLLRFTRAYF